MGDATLVYDDDCGFCTWWAEFFADRSEITLVGFSDLESPLRERLPDDYEGCSHLVTPAARYSCGASIEEAFLHTSVGSYVRPVVEVLRRLETYGTVREWGYRRFAHNRSFWARITSKTPPVRRESAKSADGAEPGPEDGVETEAE